MKETMEESATVNDEVIPESINVLVYVVVDVDEERAEPREDDVPPRGSAPTSENPPSEEEKEEPENGKQKIGEGEASGFDEEENDGEAVAHEENESEVVASDEENEVETNACDGNNEDESRDKDGNIEEESRDGEEEKRHDEEFEPTEVIKPSRMFFYHTEYKKHLKLWTRCMIVDIQTFKSMKPAPSSAEKRWFEEHP
ncbi:hypothetical protein N665_1519s0003 [Sinapis alba]|nr:hypothetical protein N665_1519s0003 [Sinapis alba]